MAGTELRLADGVALVAKFDGEFASHSSTCAGTETTHPRWQDNEGFSMSALGQSGKAQNEQMLSALPPRADIASLLPYVRFVADSCTAAMPALGYKAWQAKYDVDLTLRF